MAAASRRAAIQKVTRQATEVPLRIARAATALLPLCAPLARHGNRSAVSDVGVAVQLLNAAVPAALLVLLALGSARLPRLYAMTVAAQAGLVAASVIASVTVSAVVAEAMSSMQAAGDAEVHRAAQVAANLRGLVTAAAMGFVLPAVGHALALPFALRRSARPTPATPP